MSEHGPFVYRNAVRYNVPGHVHFYTFSCYKRLPMLTNDVWRQWLAESIAHARKELQVDLWAYVFMPEHAHLLLHPRREKYRISDFMQLAKNPMARRVIGSLKKSNAPLLESLRVTRRDGDIEHRFWQAGGGHDLNIWTMKKAIEKAEYCHNNPVKRRLARSPETWRWSSFRWLVQGARDNEPLHVDDWVGG
jgi:putative transposase